MTQPRNFLDDPAAHVDMVRARSLRDMYRGAVHACAILSAVNFAVTVTTWRYAAAHVDPTVLRSLGIIEVVVTVVVLVVVAFSFARYRAFARMIKKIEIGAEISRRAGMEDGDDS